MRFKRGALNLDTNEAKIMVDKEERPVDIVLRQRGIAERMIESFMLVANETVAEHFAKLNLPFIYRIHEEPKAEKVQKFIDYASSFGIQMRVNAIVTSVFDALIRQICVVFNQFQCDFVVLSGKPASLGSFENIFKKYLTISPSNLINLNTYWIGRWYPFADGNGFITDPKTVVSVGAIVALMAGKLFKIKELKIDTSEVTQKLISTADYIVRITDNNKETILSPKKNDNELEVSTIPFHFGYSKYLAKNYPYADLYSIRMDEKEIEAHIRRKYPSQDQNFIKEQIEKEKNTIRQNLPLKVELSRDYEESKEVIQITRVEDAQGNDKPNKYFTLHYQTLEDEKGYWLDKCEFILNAK